MIATLSRKWAITMTSVAAWHVGTDIVKRYEGCYPSSRGNVNLPPMRWPTCSQASKACTERERESCVTRYPGKGPKISEARRGGYTMSGALMFELSVSDRG